MFLRDIASYEELKACVKMAVHGYNDPLFPSDEKYGLVSMHRLLQSKCHFKVVIHEGNIVGWGCSRIGAPYPHSREKEVSLVYYQTILSGTKAVRALKIYHKSMIEYALDNCIAKCSSSSIMDTHETFYRILKQEGWIQRGSIMVYILDHRSTTPIRVQQPGYPVKNAQSPAERTRLGSLGG
jgi:hypothetical protein